MLYTEDGRDAFHVPTDRLVPDHYVTVTESSWHMTHPITCHLADCEFDQKIDEFVGLLDGGRYRWPVASRLPNIVEWRPFSAN